MTLDLARACMHACMQSMHAACMQHAYMHACMPCMLACMPCRHECMHAMHACSMHACSMHACMHACMQHACMHACRQAGRRAHVSFSAVQKPRMSSNIPYQSSVCHVCVVTFNLAYTVLYEHPRQASKYLGFTQLLGFHPTTRVHITSRASPNF